MFLQLICLAIAITALNWTGTNTAELWYLYCTSCELWDMHRLILHCSSSTAQRHARSSLVLVENFISEEEHSLLVGLCNRKLKRVEFESSHFDSVIRNYRESTFTDLEEKAPAVTRIKQLMPDVRWQTPHILQLAADGEILPHIDNIAASGKIICGLCLESPRICHFASDKYGEFMVMLPPKTLYIQQ